uniref:Uncharacterized protein n=1 Tax=Eutreptiella gymnastica TaxID=73025 RepID=A0A7S4C9K1_9EUGL|mmetsp:Transcript_8583/g.16493  ORF Transcript_8583/g.16493 Transcript_8583/m.16493 type:complete len:110 (+) Transcript_8583:115-444(+)
MRSYMGRCMGCMGACVCAHVLSFLYTALQPTFITASSWVDCLTQLGDSRALPASFCIGGIGELQFPMGSKYLLDVLMKHGIAEKQLLTYLRQEFVPPTAVTVVMVLLAS